MGLPTLSPADGVAPPLWVQGGDTLARGEGGIQFDDGTEILILKVYINPYTLLLNSIHILYYWVSALCYWLLSKREDELFYSESASKKIVNISVGKNL